MTKHPHLFALVIAVVVNAVALGAMHTAMIDTAKREQAAQFIPDRIVVTAHKYGDYQLATRACPTPKAL